MTTKKIPQYGDPELLPKGTVRRPSSERQPFTNSGELKPGGPGPLPDNFLEAPDLKGLPWKRTRGNEWTTPEFRQHVFSWLIAFFVDRPWAKTWDVKEVASSQRNPNRLPEDQLHLVVGVTRKSDGERFEAAITFPPGTREDNPDRLRAQLLLLEQTLDVLAAP